MTVIDYLPEGEEVQLNVLFIWRRKGYYFKGHGMH